MVNSGTACVNLARLKVEDNEVKVSHEQTLYNTIKAIDKAINNIGQRLYIRLKKS
jgi:hypothetical protein